jgi:hypothetical protein
MVYLHVTLKIYQGKVEKLCEILSHLVPLLEKRGWKLVGAYQNVIGRLNTVVDLWQLPDANAVESVLAAAWQEPEFQKWAAELEGCVEEEVLQIMTKVPYSP